MKIKGLILTLCVILFVSGCYEINNISEETSVNESRSEYEISNFQECVEEGNPVMESYPRKCEADGDVFVEVLSKEEKCENLYGGNWLEEHNECERISSDVCSEMGGTFESCASACRHDPDAEACIDVCVQVCSFDGENLDEDSSGSSLGDSDKTSESSTDKSLKERCIGSGGNWLEEHNECERISSDVCSELGGSFESCASACRHDPDAEACIAVCVQVCSFD